jgi:sugar O-acyltransferase (sialic acid O-acetyltransferase NeuD family)
MNKLIIWGAGGHGKVVLDVARAVGVFREAVFIDDSCVEPGGRFCDCELFPSSQRVELLKARGFRFFIVAVGDNLIREQLFRQGINSELVPISLIHPSAVVSAATFIGDGTVGMPRIVVNAGAVIGRNCILNTGAIVEHDCQVGDHVHLAPGTILGGGVTVEPFALVGLGAIALPGALIGKGAIVGAGAVVLDSVSPGAIATGVPAKALSHAKR